MPSAHATIAALETRPRVRGGERSRDGEGGLADEDDDSENTSSSSSWFWSGKLDEDGLLSPTPTVVEADALEVTDWASRAAAALGRAGGVAAEVVVAGIVSNLPFGGGRLGGAEPGEVKRRRDLFPSYSFVFQGLKATSTEYLHLSRNRILVCSFVQRRDPKFCVTPLPIKQSRSTALSADYYLRSPRVPESQVARLLSEERRAAASTAAPWQMNTPRCSPRFYTR